MTVEAFTFNDAALIDGAPRRTADGSLVMTVRAARVGLYDYAGYELGRPELARVTVYRPEEAVFARDSMASYASAPVTNEHPPEMVTADNWKRFAVGDVGEDIVRDGEFVRVPLIVRDAETIRAIEAGKREISPGYACELVFGDGQTPDGRTYNAIVRSIKVNHVAIVDRARGGSKLRIGDRRETAEPADGGKTVSTKTITFDGLPVEVTDAAEAVIVKLQAQVADGAAKLAAAETRVGELTASVATKDGEIAALNAKLKDAEVTPAKLQQLAEARAKVIADAKKVGGDDLVTDGKTDVEIKRAAVEKKLGDAAKDMADAAIDGAFGALLATGADVKDGVRDVIANMPANVVDAQAKAEEARKAAEAGLSSAWKPKAAA